MFEAGYIIAAVAAMDYCARHKRDVPKWLIAPAATLLCALLKCQRSRRGRSSGIVNGYRQDLIDYDRWAAVDEVKQQRKELRIQLRQLHNVPGEKAARHRENYEEMLRAAGKSNLEAFDCASALVSGTSSEGSPETRKRSYQKVERAMRDPRMAMRYCMLDLDFVRRIAAQPRSPKVKIKKWPFL